VTDLLVVADRPDPLAERFVNSARAAGRSVEHLDYPNAAGRLSLSRVGRSVQIEPTVPIFLRLPRAARPWADGEVNFHRAERCSLVWAAAALTNAPVINRPNALGLAAGWSSSTTVACRRADIKADSREIFASQPPEPASAVFPAVDESEWWFEDQQTGRILSYSERGAARGPIRAGRLRPGFELRVVTVVGARAFECQGVPASILERSMGAAMGLGLGFASVTWRWYASTASGELARVSPHPILHDVGDRWDDVASALLSELAQ
jgi:hypothetical protein